MSFQITNHTLGFIYYDVVAGVNPLARYSLLSLATDAEVDTANAAGVRGGYGDIVVPCPVGALGGITVATRRIIGVANNSTKNGCEVSVVTEGVALVQVNAALANHAMVHAVARETRTQAQTPFTNNYDMLIPGDPDLVRTYQLCLADDPAIVPAQAGSNVQYFPLGYALQPATAKYDIIPVELFRTPIYA